jgi:hypothetical protein
MLRPAVYMVFILYAYNVSLHPVLILAVYSELARLHLLATTCAAITSHYTVLTPQLYL